MTKEKEDRIYKAVQQLSVVGLALLIIAFCIYAVVMSTIGGY